MKKKELINVYLLVLSIIPAMAQENIKDTVAIEEIVVTVTKTPRNIKEIPSRVSVIKSDILESIPVLQVDDVLRFIPGVNVNRTGGIYSQRPMVTLRGLSGDEQSRTLVLINGVPINTSDEGGVNWNRINPYDIEQIEVFKGPGSSLYGNNAMGGVINII
jgi:iron complex outermembrane recepter protein